MLGCEVCTVGVAQAGRQAVVGGAQKQRQVGGEWTHPPVCIAWRDVYVYVHVLTPPVQGRRTSSCVHAAVHQNS